MSSFFESVGKKRSEVHKERAEKESAAVKENLKTEQQVRRNSGEADYGVAEEFSRRAESAAKSAKANRDLAEKYKKRGQ
jgi:hypothetical protein